MDLVVGDSVSWPGFLSPKQKGKKCTPPTGCDLSGMSFQYNYKAGVMTHMHVHTGDGHINTRPFLQNYGDLTVQLRF